MAIQQGQEPKPVTTLDTPEDQEIDLDTWDDIVADKYQVPKGLMRAIRSQESGGDINAVSPTGVKGRYQVTKRVAQSFGLDRDDPFQQSVAAAKYLRQNYDSLKDIKDDQERWLGSTAIYYGGPSAVKNGELSGSSIDSLSNPAEHVRRVAEKWGALNRGGSGVESAPVVQPKPQTKPARRRAGAVVPVQQAEPGNPFSLRQPTAFQSAVEKALAAPPSQKPGPLRIEDVQTQSPRFMTPEERGGASEKFLQKLESDQAIEKYRAEAAMKAQLEEEATRAPSSLPGRVGSRIARGVVTGTVNPIAAQLVTNRDPLLSQVGREFKQDVQGALQKYLPVDERNPATINPLSSNFYTAENIGKVFSENLPEAAGSMIPYILLGRGAGLASRLVAGTELAEAAAPQLLQRLGIKTVEDLVSAASASGLGSMQGVTQGYEAAKAAGLSEDAARKSGMVEGLIGLLEGAGAPATRGTFIKSTLREIPKEAREEFIQELSSQFLQGLNAAYLTGYEPNKEFKDVVGEALGSGGVGAVLGGLAATPGGVAGVRESSRPQTQPMAGQSLPAGETQPSAPQNLQAAAEAALRNQQPGPQTAPQQALNERIQALEARSSPQQPGRREKDTRDLDQRISDADAMAPADPRLAISEYQKALGEIRKTPAYRQEAVAKGQGQAVETPNMDRALEIEQRIKALQQPASPTEAPEQAAAQPDVRVYNPGEQPGTPQRGRALTTFRTNGQEFFVEYPRNISARAAIALAKQQSAGEATGQPSEIDAVRAEFQQQGAARQVEQQIRQEAGLPPKTTRAQRAEADRQQLFDASRQIAEEAGARAEELAAAGRMAEAVTELRAQQKALSEATRYAPRSPEGLRIKTDLQRQSGRIGNRIGDLRRAGGQAQPGRSPLGEQPRVEPLLESRVNPEGGIPEQASAYEPGASFERLAAEARAPRDEGENLLTAIRRAGGIRDDSDTSGELRRLGIREAGTTGLVNNRGGVSPDQMREMMVSEGLSRAETVGEFFDEIEQEMRAAQGRKGREEEDLGDYYERQAGQTRLENTPEKIPDENQVETRPTPRTVGSYLDEVAGELEPGEAASLRRAIERSETENPRAYEERTRSGEPGSGGVSLSPYSVLIQNNRQAADRLYDLDLRSEEAGKIIDDLRDYSINNGIELKHLHALLDYVRNYQIDKATAEDFGQSFEESPSADREQTLGYLNDQEQRVNRALGAAIARLDDRTVEWIRRSGRDIDQLLQTLNEDPDMMALFDGAVDGSEEAYAEFEEGALNTYGFSPDAARFLVEQERESRRLGSTNRGRAAAARVEEKLAQADRERTSERSDQESTGRQAPGRGLTARDFDLINRNPEEIPDNEFDNHLRAVEDLRNQGITTSLFGGIDLSAGEERQIQAVLSMLNEVRTGRRKEGHVGRKNEPQRVPSIEERQERYKLQEETRGLPEEERRQQLAELRQRQAEESGGASAPRLSKQELAEEMKKGGERTVTHSDPALDGKPVIAETQDGRVIVPNPDNKSGVSIVKDRSDEETEHKFSSTQVNLPAALAEKVKEFGRRIPDADLAEDGREDEPHITVKYGLRGSRPGGVRDVLEGEGPIRAKLGNISLFTANPDFDVVKIEVESEDLARLNEAIREGVPNEEKFPEYKPHVTIAYVKKGKGAKYIGDTTFEGQQVDFDRVLFSGRAGNRENIPLAEGDIIPPNAKPETKPEMAGGAEAPARTSESVLGAGESASGRDLRATGQTAQSTGVPRPGREAGRRNDRSGRRSGSRSRRGGGEAAREVRPSGVSRPAEELATRQPATQREGAPPRPESAEGLPGQTSAESGLAEGAPRQNQPGQVGQRPNRGSERQSVEKPRQRIYEEAGRIPVAETQTPGGIPLSAATGEDPEPIRDARQRLRDAGSGKLAGSGARQLADLALVTGWDVYKRGMSFSAWFRSIIKQAGQAVRPYLQSTWDQIQAFYRDEEGSLKVSPGPPKQREENKVNRVALLNEVEAIQADLSSLEEYLDDEGSFPKGGLKSVFAQQVWNEVQGRAKELVEDFAQREVKRRQDELARLTEEGNRLEAQLKRGEPDSETIENRLQEIDDEEYTQRDEIKDLKKDLAAIRRMVQNNRQLSDLALENEITDPLLEQIQDIRQEGVDKISSELQQQDEQYQKVAKQQEKAGGHYYGAGLGSLQAWFDRPKAPRSKVPLPSDWSGVKWSGNLAKQLREGIAAGKISDRRATKIVEAIDEALAAEASDDGARLFLAREELAKLTGEKFSLADLAGAPRSIKAGLDLSFALRQGGAYNFPGFFLRPVETLKRIGKGFAAMREANYADINAQIAARPRFDEMMESGLHLSNQKKLEGNKLTDKEEGYIARFMQGIRGYKQSERGNTTLLDLLRADTFDRYAAYLNKRGVTFEQNPQAFKQMARFVNLMTGRGTFGNYEGAVPFLSLAMFSPRWVMSRVQLLNMSLNPLAYRKVDPSVRKLMWRDLGAYAGAIGLTLGLLAAAGAAGLADLEVGDDPQDSDFGKVVINGKYHYDLTSGLQQYLVFATRMATSFYRRDWLKQELRESQKPSTIALRFLRGKASPAGSLAANLMTGEDFNRQPISAKSAALDLVYPLLVKDFLDGYNLEGGSLAGGLASLPATMGIGYGAQEKGGQASRVPELRREAEKYDVFFGEKRATGALQGEPESLTKERLARRRQYVEKYGSALIGSDVYKSATEEGKAALLKRFNDVSNDLANEKAPDLGKLNPARLEAALRQGGKQVEQKRRRATQRQIYARPPAAQ